jgi:hypothetical protein
VGPEEWREGKREEKKKKTNFKKNKSIMLDEKEYKHVNLNMLNTQMLP